MFPCGEGAGYAGGIAYAAMDGERCAEQLVGLYGKISCSIDLSLCIYTINIRTEVYATGHNSLIIFSLQQCHQNLKFVTIDAKK
jgi:hypothetical protein